MNARERRAIGVLDDVLCNNDLFGDHKGEMHCTYSLHPVFPGSMYEITPAGRLELLECTYEDRSDPNASGCVRFRGMMTPVFTGRRSDVALHGWVEFPGFGRAKFTDGTMLAFEPASELSNPEETTGALSARSPDLEAPIYMQGEALGRLRVNGRTAEAICQTCRHCITDGLGSRAVLQRFWAHQVFEHHVPPDLIGVEGLEEISTAGIQLAVQIVVRSRPQS
jgi:hypothetical protein